MQGGDQVRAAPDGRGLPRRGRECAARRSGGGEPGRLDVRQRCELAPAWRGSAASDGRGRHGRGPRTSAAVAWPNIVVSGVVTASAAPGAGANQRTVTVRSSGVWRSTDNGATWTAVTVPVSNGATAAVTGLAATANGLVAVRPGQSGAGTGAVVFTSADGAAWKFADHRHRPGRCRAHRGHRGRRPGGCRDHRQQRGNLLAFTSASGTAWRPAGALGSATAGTIAGVAVDHRRRRCRRGQRSRRATRPAARADPRQPGPAHPGQLRAHTGRRRAAGRRGRIAADGSSQVAVGSANGFPAGVVLRQRRHQLDPRHRRAHGRAGPGPACRTLSSVVHGIADGSRSGVSSSRRPSTGSWSPRRAARPGRLPTAPPPSPALVPSPSPPRRARAVTSSSGASRSRGAWSPRPGGSAGLTGWQRGTDAAAGALDGGGAGRCWPPRRTQLASPPSALLAPRPAAWISPNGPLLAGGRPLRCR